ncbi:eukaryotic translation initiation factor subunit eIF-4F, putative [Talaromyces stipitatus ATCC 10500]|uniref:Eukaryotic translation initiation factor subunit eIF-4F, putative n=1 Tax=Talaromyces stipitatus (strain ATCC 10500 / CBS 375.48 / QM 6759 / NRRL 1006) TaxID=441959 RepID=B8MCA4_TALSN|nr:eukaryotic translation initiation factor subunit eIF-4F, putative [Talaromyces stipitatus ATCC 10500]EED18550.1 eukaryotic translation initiation factor subunit eIF-4F, putative [Talaromyces stipitatus ATCC 10500]
MSSNQSREQTTSSSPLANSAASTRTYANATQKLDSELASAHHGNSPSTTLNTVNGKLSMQNPQTSGVTIVNGAPPVHATDHTRKQSVTITSAGATGFIPNGGPAGNPNRNSIQFGSVDQQNSPAMSSPALPVSQPHSSLNVAQPVNPRITSPSTSPSPIPQPASSGGRPPSTYQAPGNAPNFGSFGEASGDAMRMGQNNLGPGPQATHLRRESSQSQHSDMGGHIPGGPGGPARGGYQGGRGRGYSGSGYQNQMGYQSGPNYRATPNQPRGGPNMGAPFHAPNHGRPIPYPSSPHQAARSPAMSNANPVTPQMSHVPMSHSQMANQHYGAYNQHMGPQNVRTRNFSSSSLNINKSWKNKKMDPYQKSNWRQKSSQGTQSDESSVTLPKRPPVIYPMDPPPPPPPPPAPRQSSINLNLNLAPESGQFEQFLTMVKNQNYPHGGYDPNSGYYYPAYGVQQNMYMPPSPQPRPGIPYGQPTQFMPNQFPAGAVPPPVQSTPLSRSTSQISNDRPGSSLGQGPAAAVAPAPGHAHTESRSSNSPAPQKNHFIIPTPKKSAIVIKDPNSGAVKSFEKQPASPARATPSPVKGSAPTPPPRATSGVDHARTESKSVKTDEEKKKELRDAVRMKIEQDEAEQRRKEEDARKAIESLSIADKEESKAKAEPTATPAAEPTKEEVKPEVEEPVVEKKAEEKAAPSAPAGGDDEIDYDAIERELAEIEAREAAAEAEYQKKKQAQKEEAERKKKEEEEAYERNMKQAEREAEAAEEARLKKLEAGGAAEEDSSKLFASLRKGGLPASESPAPQTPDDSGAATPVSQSDASMGPPSKPASVSKAKPGPLKLETKPVEPPQPSAALKSLHSAKFLDSLANVTYPPSIASPNPALNASAPSDRKFKYNKEFLLQFQNVFKEKPTLDWDLRIRETVGDSDTSRPQSARTPGAGRTASRGGIPSNFKMGQFGGGSTPSVGTPRDAFPNPTGRMPSMGSGPFGPFGRPGSMGPGSLSRPGSSAALHNVPQSPRPGSSRTGTRTGSRRDKQSAKKEEETNKAMPLTAGLSLKPLEISSSGWKPRSVAQATAGPTPGGESDYMPPDVVQRKVKANLNKMTPENFDRIAQQILDIVSQSKNETDGRTLRQVIQLTFEKATDEAHWAPMYAKFCKRMLENMSPEIKDENIKDKAGNVVAGGSLFRKYLLNRCQEEFERGWKVNLPPKPEGDSEAAALMSDEYYIAAAAKRRGLGLVKFIGELYKLGMLTERIMHECVKKLVDYEGVPDEAEVESLTSLLRTIGASLDVSEKGHAMMDAYFGRISMMMETPGLPSRLKFMLMDVVDLRAANWVSKGGDKGPKTLQEIREEAARAQQEAEMERLRQQASRGGGGRMPMGRGDARNFSGDYRNQAPPPDYTSSKVGSDDLRRLKTSRTINQPASFGPSSMFGSRSSSGRKNLGPGGNLVRGGEDSGASSRTGTPPAGKKDEKEAASSVNAFSALASLEDNMATSPPSNPTSPELTKSQPVKNEGESA